MFRLPHRLRRCLNAWIISRARRLATTQAAVGARDTSLPIAWYGGRLFCPCARGVLARVDLLIENVNKQKLQDEAPLRLQETTRLNQGRYFMKRLLAIVCLCFPLAAM